MKYCSAAKKKNDIMEFSSKWNWKKKDHSDWGNPDSERQTQFVLTYKWILDVKLWITGLQSIAPEKLSNKWDLRVMITLEGQVDATSYVNWCGGMVEGREWEHEEKRLLSWGMNGGGSNENDILIEVVIMRLGRNLGLWKFPGKHKDDPS